MPVNDNRRSSREKHDSVLEIFDATGEHIAWTGTLVDCSDTGACFVSGRTLEVGDTVQARLRLLSRGALDISARVVWRRKAGKLNRYGIRFDSVTSVHPSGELKKPI